MENTQPKVIVYDIESNFNIGKFFDLTPERISPSNIIQERYIICVAYKEFGKKGTKVISVLDDKDRFQDNPNDDFYVVTEIHKVLSEADAIIHHYGDNFDIKMLNSRFIYHGLPPLPPIIQIDTYKIARRHFKFNSNKLDYLGNYFGVGGKISTSGDLWHRCLAGEESAIKEMMRYNKQDVDLLEQVYIKLAPYAPAKLNLSLFDRGACPLCGEYSLEKRGTRRTVTTVWQRYQCSACGHWSQSSLEKDNIR